MADGNSWRPTPSRKPAGPKLPAPPRRPWLLPLLLFSAYFLWEFSSSTDWSHPSVSYSEFYDAVSSGQVKRVQIRGRQVVGEMADAAGAGRQGPVSAAARQAGEGRSRRRGTAARASDLRQSAAPAVDRWVPVLGRTPFERGWGWTARRADQRQEQTLRP